MLAGPSWDFDQLARQPGSEEVAPDEMATTEDDNQMSAIDPDLSIDEDEVEMLDAAAPKKRKAEGDAEEPATKRTKADEEDASDQNVPTAEDDN